MSRARRTLGAALVALVLAGVAGALGDDAAANAPSQCTVCGGDPELMRAAGIVSHGGFEFGREDTVAIDRLLATSDIKWIESAHFKIGIGLGTYKVRTEERNKLREELGRMATALPEVSAKAKVLDPWLRAHLYAQRAEDLYARFLAIVRVEDSAFPDGTRVWDQTYKYMGEGPYLGMKAKYEILLLASEAESRLYLERQFGAINRETQRWHLPDRQSISITTHETAGQLRQDMALHGHVAFNLAHNFLDGYKHYAYETPVWLHEGLAHCFERELDPDFNTFDSAEGAAAAKTSKSDWEGEMRKMIASGDAPRFPELIGLKTYADLELDHHYATWSVVRYLLDVHPEELAKLLDGINGLKDERGWSDGSQLADRQRDLFRELFGTTYAQFDELWKAWAATPTK